MPGQRVNSQHQLLHLHPHCIVKKETHVELNSFDKHQPRSDMTRVRRDGGMTELTGVFYYSVRIYCDTISSYLSNAI